jgi:hypothetical protein
MLGVVLTAIVLVSNAGSAPGSQHVTGRDDAHDNNNLWTVFDSLHGDIGSLGATHSSMEFPGGTGDNHLYRGCDWIGFTSPEGETLVVANGLC